MPQFGSRQELREHYVKALEKSTEIYINKFPGLDFQEFVERTDAKSKILRSQLAQEAHNLNPDRKPHEIGTLIHRFSELRTMVNKQNSLLKGTRFVELGVNTGDEEKGEIDLVAVRGDKHFIYDYKPIRIDKIQKMSWADEFNEWLQQQHCGDHTQISSYQSMSPELHKQFKDYLSSEISTHRTKIRHDYAMMYSKQTGVPFNKVKNVVILPYFIKW